MHEKLLHSCHAEFSFFFSFSFSVKPSGIRSYHNSDYFNFKFGMSYTCKGQLLLGERLILRNIQNVFFHYVMPIA